MTDRTFDMRLSCAYTGNENDVIELEVEHFNEGAWETFEPGLQSPGFLIFVYAIFHCQHRLFRVTAAKQDLLLDSARGTINVTTGTNWKIKTLQIEFRGKLRAGEARQEVIDVITGAMKACPVSVNLPEVTDATSIISFV